MPSKPKSTAAQQLNAAQLAIANSLADPEIKAAVAQFGYTTAKLNRARRCTTRPSPPSTPRNRARAAERRHRQLKAALADARDAYQALAKVARATLEQEDQAKWGWAQSRAARRPSFKPDTRCSTMRPRWRRWPIWLRRGSLAAERAKIEAFDQANQAQEMAKGAAQQATQDQDAALAALSEWVAQYLKIAKVALRGKKQLLEKIGVTARTSKTAAQKAAPPRRQRPAKKA